VRSLVTDSARREAARPLAMSVAAGLTIQLALIVSGVGAARLLGAENRGQLALIVLFPLAITQFGGLGLPVAVTFFIARANSQTRSIVHTVLRPVLVQSVVLTALTALVFALVFRSADREVQVAAFVSLVMVPATLAEQYGLGILQGLRRFRSFNILRTASVFLYSSGIVSLFIFGGESLLLVVLAWTFAYVVSGIATLVKGAWCIRAVAGNEPGPSLREMLAFGTKSVFGWVSPIEYGLRLDQQVVGLALSPTALGLYVVAQSFTNLPRFVAQSIGMVGYPTIASQSSEPEARRAVWRYFWITAALCVPLVIVLEVLMPTLVELFYGEEYSGATTIARVLLVAAILWSLRRVLTDASRGLGRPMIGTVGEATLGIVLVVLLLIFATRHGATGVALALCIASASALAVIAVPLALPHRRGNPAAARPVDSAEPVLPTFDEGDVAPIAPPPAARRSSPELG
jgi:O-antigen/teichoic acid export membrane protein